MEEHYKQAYAKIQRDRWKLLKQNKRYREALEAIAYSAEKPEGKITTRVDAKYIASKALEGEEID